MNRILKLTAHPLSLLAIPFLFAASSAPAQQLQPTQPSGNDADTGIYSPAVNRLSSPSILGPIGSYGGAFSITNQPNTAAGRNATGQGLEKSEANALLRSAWGGAAGGFSGENPSSWTAGAGSFGVGKSASWVAGTGSFGMSAQAGGVWRSVPSTSFSLPSAVGLTGSAAQTAVANPSALLLGSGTLPALPKSSPGGHAANGISGLQSPFKSQRGLGSSLPGGIAGPFGRSHPAYGTSRRHGSSSSKSSRLGSKAGSSQPSRTLSNPLSRSSSSSGSQLNSAPDSDLDGTQQ